LSLNETVKATVSLESYKTKVEAPIYINIKDIGSGKYVQHIK